jgi:hypothetical protein
MYEAVDLSISCVEHGEDAIHLPRSDCSRRTGRQWNHVRGKVESEKEEEENREGAQEGKGDCAWYQVCVVMSVYGRSVAWSL